MIFYGFLPCLGEGGKRIGKGLVIRVESGRQGKNPMFSAFSTAFRPLQASS